MIKVCCYSEDYINYLVILVRALTLEVELTILIKAGGELEINRH